MISILLLAFGLNALAPSGYMISATDGGLPTVIVCPETHPLARAVAASREEHQMHGSMAMDHAAMGHPDDDGTAPVTASDGHCTLASAAKLALPSADETLRAADTAYAVLLGLSIVRPLQLREAPYLRPPLRGPPPSI
ncbi:hypothetical protein [Aurantiacibacter zhengii]|uniref:DUF2946 domain-containing protein n=1 Tax=Aurantiacibacter zhengii TaxID=2307003 RepID=A0A418NNF3_9SPHN|nr:hypothetical protein [Aurantiacibacter zhengii]RIV82815.1 hypothetical protein D2V07_17485 [Aurantiacibacter zhengii]